MSLSILSCVRRHRLDILMWSTAAGALVLWISAWSELEGGSILGEHASAVLVFSLLLLATEMKPMPSLTDETELTASWAFAFTLLLIAPLAGALLAVGVAPIITDALKRKGLARTLFNSGQFMLSLAGGGLAGSLVTDLSAVANGEPVTVRWLVGVGVACSVGFALNSVFVSVAVALHAGLPVAEMLRRSVGINLNMDGLLLALVPVFVVVGLTALMVVPLLLLTVWIIFRSAALALRNKHEATHDQLTGIANRRLFEDHSALIIKAAAPAGEIFAVVQIDLDGFKGINDRLGHHYGDLVLIEVAKRLSEGERSADQAARLGGDEFALLIREIDDQKDAQTIAERVLARMCEPMNIEGVPLTIGASMGVAIFPRHGEDIYRLNRHADLAMYQAKAAGGGVRVFDHSDDEIAPGRISLLNDLASALENGELSLAYQPKADLLSGRIVMVEALIRWNHPVHGDVRPGWFMPQAEQTDLIGPLTDYVIDLALMQCREWHDEGIEIGVAINASASNLHDLRFPGRVRELLARYDLAPHLLEIEITENSVMEDPIRSAIVLAHLREVGLTLAIDDFGTGYSSLSSLRDLSVDRIKIDRSFVTNLVANPGDLVITRSVIELGHNLGLRTVAEGVETTEVLNILRDLGCDEVQGYLLAVPQTAAEITPLLRRGRVALDELTSPGGSE